MKVSIILLNYKSESLIIDFYNRFLKSDIRKFFELIIVDNSPEHLKEFVWAKDIHYINSVNNIGYAKGNNLGLQKSIELGCKFSFIFNPDLVIRNLSILNNIYNDLKYDIDKTAVYYLKVKGQSVYYSRPLLIEIMFPFLKYLFSKRRFNNSNNNIYRGSGSCLFVNLILLADVNFFADDTFLFYEEAILAEKLNTKGYITKLYDKFEFIHLASYSINQEFKFYKIKLMFDSLKIYLNKYRKISRPVTLIVSLYNISYITIKELIKWLIK